MKTWADLLAALRDQNAYEGDGSLADVQKFLGDNDIKVMGDLSSLFKRSKATKASGQKVVKIEATAGEEVEVVAPPVEAEMADGEEDEEMLAKRAPAPARKSTPHRIPDFNTGGSKWAGRIKQYERRAADPTLPREARPAFADGEKALAFAGWLKSMHGASTVAERDAMKHFGIEVAGKAANGSVFTQGGALVPEEFLPELIELKEVYGVGRRLCRVVNMGRDVLSIPRLTDDITVYKPGENVAATASQPAFDSVKLTAEKWAALTQASSEIVEDSALSFADTLMGSFARAFAKQEDTCIFNGDGTSTYLGVLGFHYGFRKLVTDAGGTWPTNIAYAGGVQVASGNAYSEVVIGDTLGAAAKLPVYASANPTWVCSRSASAQTLERLNYAGGGNTVINMGGGFQQSHLGAKIEYAQVMDATASNSGIIAYYGDFSKAATIGDRREYRVDVSTDKYFAEDALAFRATQRIAIAVHDIGTGASSGAVAGPVIALALANS